MTTSAMIPAAAGRIAATITTAAPIVVAPSSHGEELVAQISAALPTAFVFGARALCAKVA